MAYTAVAQAERDTLSDDRPSFVSVSHDANQVDEARRSLNFGPLNQNAAPVNARLIEDRATTQLQSILRSLTSTLSSDAMQEDGGTEGHQVSPLNIKKRGSLGAMGVADAGESSLPPAPSNQPPPIRTASISCSLPLNHPTPDLQSLQGAYVKNVERLEESAERLSMTSSLEEELQKMKLEQKLRQRQFSAPVSASPHIVEPSRQFSTGSITNSIIGVNTAARSGGYSPGGYITSPKESILSGSWSQPSNYSRLTSKGSRVTSRFSEPESAAGLVDSSFVPPISTSATYFSSLDLYEEAALAAQREAEQHAQAQSFVVSPVERSSTSASNDTYRQATTLFVDFDGVHYTQQSQLSRSQRGSVSRHVSLTQPPLATDSRAFQEPPPGERMVYYPAPVPMILNLPQKLSTLPSATERERRRLKAINEMPEKMRNAASWLRNGNDAALGLRSKEMLEGLPPQLRANAFFDQPAKSIEVEVRGASAVATLDSILDASAHAPVSAFTDHPIVGHLGKEVYGKAEEAKATAKVTQRKNLQSISNNMLRNNTGVSNRSQLPLRPSSAELSTTTRTRITSRESKAIEMEMEAANMTGEDLPLRPAEGIEHIEEHSISPGDDEILDGEVADGEGHDLEEESDGDALGYAGPPTTLLAELQMRKAQQKQRNRSAATAFPNGMHSTLLELDAVAQLQQKSRKQKHIALAWEDHDLADRQNFDDEDVPLGLLFSSQKAHNNVNRPIGLMEKREIEDNEPLSARRNRLRGDVVQTREGSLADRPGSRHMYKLEVPGLTGSSIAEQEGESLAQRIMRLKEEKVGTTILDRGILKEGSRRPGLKTEDPVTPSKTPDVEETLAQRRKRLKEEALKASRQASGGSSQPTTLLKPKHSMASILSAHPVGGGSQLPNEPRGLPTTASLPRHGLQMENHTGLVPVFQQVPMMAPTTVGGGVPQYHSFKAGVPFAHGAFHYNPALAMQLGGFGPHGVVQYANDLMMGPPLDPKQRDVIDQWRQSVVR